MFKIPESAILAGILAIGAFGCDDPRDNAVIGCLFDGGIVQDAGPGTMDADVMTLPDASEMPDGGDCDGGACACAVNTKMCVPGDPAAEFVCEQGANGPEFVRHTCAPMSFCSGASCQPCTSSLGPCKLGERKCDGDARTVMLCGCFGWQPALDCASVGMTTCIVPTSPDPPLSPSDPDSAYCVNECGGRNIPLEHNLCDPDPNATCGYLVCDPNTFQLAPEHTACLPAGVACTKNSDCKSCMCSGGTCIGNTEKSCVPFCP